MHARHRSPGNGYRSSSTTGMGMGLGMGMGMGMALSSSSRISPDAAQSLRTPNALYSSDSHYRNFNRGGFGRPHPHPPNKSFPPSQHPPPPPPPPPPLPRKADIFMEAGRLAAEYLVSQGLLPSTVLSTKASSKKHQQQHFGELFPEFSTRQHESDDTLQLPQEGRTSALARLGNAIPDAASGRRRFALDDFGSLGFRTHLKGRRRAGLNRPPLYSSDWGREYSRRASFLDRPSRVSPDTEVDDDTVSGQREVGKDVGNGIQKFRSNDLPSKSEDAADSESELEKLQFLDDRSSRPSSSAWVDSLHETEEEPGKIYDDMSNMELGTEQVRDCAGIHETEKQIVTEDLFVQHKAVETASSGDIATDLLTLCRFAKVPTRIRSSLTSKSPKVEPPSTTELENDSDILSCSVPQSGTVVAHDSLDSSLSDALLDKTYNSEHLNSKVFKAQTVKSAENVRELGSVYNLEQSNCVRSLSFSDRAFICHTDRESSQGQLGLGSCRPMVKERGEKRVLEDKDIQEGAKKLKECLPPVVVEADESFRRSNLNEKEFSARNDGTSSGEKAIMAVCHDGTEVNDSQLPKEGGEHCVKYAEEKQLFPSSFKICDLNLMEVSDTHENHDGDPIIIYPTLSEMKREATQVDIDLSISNSSVSGENNRCPVDGKEIEVIDLENDSAQEDKNLSIVERKTETVFPGLEGFSNPAQNASDIPDVQDGYGLMISELLGSDFPNCSSVPGDMNSMHNDIVLHNGEGALADDDSIYMSLGEIPLSMPDF
ncbi:hypothetical protein FNV43_RR03671 [Rhamnella rubrinervis]|uniref:Uncharacterized protein n=1 Tax=Rhamnella rubrinervis TaxID=2594499 RepID=A0A8K0MNW7_9ROSA|nr:hypothetical protein FNV43_RR03671 [Rhamnella rubrinervis]